MNTKYDILFLCQFFYPEHNSSATLPFDTAKCLANEGFSVGALCGYPKEYNDTKKVTAREKKDGVSIHRLRYLQLSRQSKLGRLVNYFSFILVKSFDVVSNDCLIALSFFSFSVALFTILS